jgi:hypothetical protein
MRIQSDTCNFQEIYVIRGKLHRKYKDVYIETLKMGAGFPAKQ